MLRWFDRLVRGAEARPFHALQIFLSASWVAIVRFLEEKAFVYDARPQGLPPYDLGIAVAWLCFYVALGFALSAVVTHLGRVDWRRSCQVVSFGLTLAVLPPLIDVLVYGLGNFSYRYQESLFDGTTFLLFNPKGGLPLGETITVWLAILFTGLYVYRKTVVLWRAIAAGVTVYLIGVFFGVLLPIMARWLDLIPGANRFGDDWMMAWTGLAIALVAYVILRPPLCREGWIRIPQVVLGPAVVLLGAAFVGRVNILTLQAAITFTGMTTVFAIANLAYDRAEDLASGRSSAVEHDDAVAMQTWALLVVLTLLRHHVHLAMCASLFLLASFAYHSDVFRTKCVFPLSYKSEGFFAATAFLAGILCQDLYRLRTADVVATFLVLGGFSIATFFKDVKDVEGDRRARVCTVYVLLAKRGWSVARTHVLSVVLLAVALVVPVIYLMWLGTPSGWISAPAAAGLATIAATLLPRRRLAVALGVVGVDAYIVLLALALLVTPATGPV